MTYARTEHQHFQLTKNLAFFATQKQIFLRSTTLHYDSAIMEDKQFVVRFQVNTAVPAEEDYIGGSHHPQGCESDLDNNFFYMTGLTLYELKRNFPLQGDYHFRCLSEAGDCWIDLTNDQDDLMLQSDNTIELRALDLSRLMQPPRRELTYEEEVLRIEEFEEKRRNRPHCFVPNDTMMAGRAGSEGGDDETAGGSVRKSATDVAKKGIEKASALASKVKGFFR